MTLTRRHAAVLLAIAAWNVFTYLNFAKNLWSAYDAGEDRATGYWVAHTVLIVVNLAIAALLTVWARRIWRATAS